MCEININEIFEKAVRTIDSCSTREQLQSAQSFVDLYRSQTNDEEGFKSLQRLLLEKDQSIFSLVESKKEHEENI
jgi:succinate dehydrogenase flavin-adding protein (antitoxin of CptAB toxin-antitoxin module)